MRRPERGIWEAAWKSSSKTNRNERHATVGGSLALTLALPAAAVFPRGGSVASTQVVLETDKDIVTKDGIRVCPAHVFLREFV